MRILFKLLLLLRLYMDIQNILHTATKRVKYELPILIGNEMKKIINNYCIETVIDNDAIDNFCLYAKNSEIFDLIDIFTLSPDIQNVISEEIKTKLRHEQTKRMNKMEQE